MKKVLSVVGSGLNRSGRARTSNIRRGPTSDPDRDRTLEDPRVEEADRSPFSTRLSD